MLGVKKARAIGFNLIALEVNDIDEALAFYGSLFDFKLRGRVRIQPSLTSAISFLRSRRDESKLRTTIGISDLWLTIRKPFARPYRELASDTARSLSRFP
jgi:hypothetical protein